MSGAEKSEFSHSEAITPPRRSKAGIAHCKKYWWVHLLILIVIVAIVTPVLILVAVPKIAQQKIDAATLSVDGVVISQTESNSLHMAINSTISVDGSIKATIGAFNGTMILTDYDPNFKFATLQFPEVKSESLIMVNISQELPIEYMTELTIFNTYLLTRESVHVRIIGDTTVRVSGIARDYPVTFDKEIEFVGFNSFNGLAIENPHVQLTTRNNFNATAVIPNPTLWTIDVGNVTFYTFFNESLVGETDLHNMVLYPGNNSFPVNGTIDQVAILNALDVQPYCSNGGILPIDITGNTVVNNGQSLSYFAQALGSYNETVSIDIGAAVKPLGLTVACPNSSTAHSLASTTSTSIGTASTASTSVTSATTTSASVASTSAATTSTASA
ncbi:hypothetical protein BX600DRAFT_494225 [Xylariales sp. PMI_506]|nr:hypothetical protein BX600DRAFT_494225 [Xylariales sp. PMI_506]